ncbi:unnamed protein product [Mytilus edulis]|uniref:DZIP3-like HEPN domain-containing protein n=1 Tax=Mytilus edulis TaxID=6550 RepID=A0A8S3TAV5_MYTED|nr:unnamed protein product [Mytilus edulis]
MSNSVWITGPQFLLKDKTDDSEKFTLQNPDTDKELRPDVLSLKTGIEYPQRLGTSRFGRFSLWKTLIKAIAHLKHVAQSFASKSSCTRWHICSESASVNAIDEARKLVLREAQIDTFSDEIECLTTRKPLAKSSCVVSLTPFLDKENMLRIGGRIQNSNVPDIEKHPILLSGRHHIALLIFSNKEFNRLKMGIIVLNILADFMYDRLTLDGQHLRARKDYDISMLYNKHRNLNIHRPSNSNNRHYSPWGGTWQDIQNTDTAIGDDIERIRLIRNELHHSTTYELDDTRFIELCNIIHEMVRRFDQHNKPKVMYTKRVKEILSKAKHV